MTTKRVLAVWLAALVVILALIWFFRNFISRYQDSITAESASHLVEISYQVASYIEGKIDNDWKVAESIADGFQTREQAETDDLLAFMRNEQDIWGVSNIVVYTEDGCCVNAEGDAVRPDEAAEFIYGAQQYGQCMTIKQSTVTYTVPLESRLLINGSRAVAVSTVQNLDSFLDGMDFSSFDGEAFMYLAQSGGAKISQLTHPNAPEIHNILTLFDDMDCICLTQEGYTVEDTMITEEISTFLCRNDNGSWYVVLMPVKNGDTLWQLCYWVPEGVVNATMDGFTSSVIGLSIAIIVFLAFCTLITFRFIYQARRRQFDSALMVRERLYDQLVVNTQIAFALLSTRQAEPLYCSSNVKDIIGYSYLGLVVEGQRYRMIMPDGMESEAVAKINSKLAEWDGNGSFISDYVPHAEEGCRRYYVMRLYPSENDAEFVGIAQDVTKEREREEALKNALTMADSANHAKTRFLANMSHDIRTPMNAIMNMTRFLMESVDEPEKQTEYLKTILDSSGHLLHIINDILDMSRIESGQDAIAAEPFELQKMLDEICEMIRPLCMAKQQGFTVDFSNIQTNHLIGDRIKLSQVLINLLNNAMKFTPAGGLVHFAVLEMRSLRSETAAFRFVIEDSGMGIDPKQIPGLFEPFTRAENTKVRSIEGTGLGLSICKSYVTAMGGTIACDSTVDAGSVFTVELSFDKDSAQPSHTSTHIEETAASFKNMRALLCEDNEINQMIACRILEQLGFEVEIAGDGAEAVDTFISSAPGDYDVIYMDIQMPEMNGYEATVAIRASGHPQARSVPIIAMTANVYAEDVEKSRASGMNAHIGKPLVIKDLIYETNKALKGGG